MAPPKVCDSGCGWGQYAVGTQYRIWSRHADRECGYRGDARLDHKRLGGQGLPGK